MHACSVHSRVAAVVWGREHGADIVGGYDLAPIDGKHDFVSHHLLQGKATQ